MITKELINTELGAILAELGTPVCNAAMWREELGDNAPTEEAILTKKAELEAARLASLGAEYQQQRRAAYASAGLTAEAWSLALVQKELDNDLTEWNRLKDLRLAIKAQYPKP
jgi:hypothetical protein